MTLWYLSGASGAAAREAANEGLPIGLMCQPGNRNHSQTQHYWRWAADNACFAQGADFDVSAFLVWLNGLSRPRCCFAVAPDVVADAPATMTRSLPVLPLIRAMGYPAAFVAQDGLEGLPVPWEQFDALFIGGSTAWKTSEHAAQLCLEAKQRGKWVHMGRVNSLQRLRIAEQFHCDSVDGTYLAFGPDKNIEKLRSWLGALECQPSLWSEIAS